MSTTGKNGIRGTENAYRGDTRSILHSLKFRKTQTIFFFFLGFFFHFSSFKTINKNI